MPASNFEMNVIVEMNLKTVSSGLGRQNVMIDALEIQIKFVEDQTR